MNRLADESEMKWMPLLYGVTAGLSTLVLVLLLVWTFEFRGGCAWQDYPAIQFNWHPILMVVSLVILYGHGKPFPHHHLHHPLSPYHLNIQIANSRGFIFPAIMKTLRTRTKPHLYVTSCEKKRINFFKTFF